MIDWCMRRICMRDPGAALRRSEAGVEMACKMGGILLFGLRGVALWHGEGKVIDGTQYLTY